MLKVNLLFSVGVHFYTPFKNYGTVSVFLQLHIYVGYGAKVPMAYCVVIEIYMYVKFIHLLLMIRSEILFRMDHRN